MLRYHLTESVDHELLSNLSQHQLAQRWASTLATDKYVNSPSGAIACDGQSLGLLGTFNSPSPSAPNTQGYFEGLWNYDAIEFFFWDKRSREYLEIHLGPKTLWWMASFADIRVRKKLENLDSIQHHVKKNYSSDRQVATLSLPLELLPISFRDLSSLNANICACSNSDKTFYFSLAPEVSQTPDFHRREMSLQLTAH